MSSPCPLLFKQSKDSRKYEKSCHETQDVHFEIIFWYVLAHLKGIQDVGVFVSAVVSIVIFLGQTVLSVYQSYNGGLWSPPHAQRSPN